MVIMFIYIYIQDFWTDVCTYCVCLSGRVDVLE